MPTISNSSTLRQLRLTQAKEAASILYMAGASQVWLFGSLARSGDTDRRTDIDLAVEGLSAGRRHYLMQQLRTLLQCKFDIVGTEDIGPTLRRSLLENRLLLPATFNQRTLEFLHTAQASASFFSKPFNLHQQRIQTVFDVLKASGSNSIIDFGCGAGLLLERLATDSSFTRILGVDSSSEVLAKARNLLDLNIDIIANKNRVCLIHGLATNPDPRFLGYDVAVAVELIEHLDPMRLAAFEKVIFNYVRPKLFVVTTPNVEYNFLLGMGGKKRSRHPDHRFEWTRNQFQKWIIEAAGRAGYICSFEGIGASHPYVGSPTQMAIVSLSRLNRNASK